MANDEDLDTVELTRASTGADGLPPYSSRVRVDLAGGSHTGYVRSHNEDSYLIGKIERGFSTLSTNLPADEVLHRVVETAYSLIVADGIGGAAGGEVASREVVQTLVKLALETPDWHMRLDPEGATVVLARFDTRFRQLRAALIERVQADPALTGMGTTLTVAVSLGADLVIAHAGDSRAYLFHDDELNLLTRDQTLAQDLTDLGVIRPGDMKFHYSRHILTGVIGTGTDEPQPELLQVVLTDGDQLLLCSDGLTEMVSDEAIAKVLRKNALAADACDELIEQALENGSVDNVTVALARYQMPANEAP